MFGLKEIESFSIKPGLEKKKKEKEQNKKKMKKGCKRKKVLPLTQLTLTCSKLTTETLDKRCDICSKLIIQTPKRRQ